MQYVLKVTVLGVKQHVFRVISVDGAADMEHVLNLSDLSFDYSGYNTKELYFANDVSSFLKLALDYEPINDDHYGPTGREYEDFWASQVDLSALNCTSFKLQTQASDFLEPFDAQLEAQMVNFKAKIAPELSDDRVHFKFIYVLNGVQHLVEVMTASQKLKCFLPATLMGEGLIADNDESKPLSLAMLNDFLAAHEHDENLDEGLNLKNCTARLRALGAFRSSDNINNALVKAGATPLNFVAQ